MMLRSPAIESRHEERDAVHFHIPPGNAAGAAIVLAVIVVMVPATALWVYGDAKQQATHRNVAVFSIHTFDVDTPVKWFLACLLLWEFFFPLYLGSRSPAD